MPTTYLPSFTMYCVYTAVGHGLVDHLVWMRFVVERLSYEKPQEYQVHYCTVTYISSGHRTGE